ncbi:MULTISPECIES: hypothetical protein [unclassified Moorena]|uniref:hypothetical protein n=1 Tax=unclassified Moorena TaxID=2683338 RepID=UPI001400D471|nr:MULTISPECIES: hypothetical protein [unclassified Moorena]NEO17762.1 hypothetical protein [Moorena sp. SIO3E8]NEQ04326.1 hypothetical protein [Moorena sp. SIO3F7]
MLQRSSCGIDRSHSVGLCPCMSRYAIESKRDALKAKGHATRTEPLRDRKHSAWIL